MKTRGRTNDSKRVSNARRGRKLRDASPSLMSLLDAATVLTASVGIAFGFGWLRTEGYWHRLGYDHISLALPTTYYLFNGFLFFGLIATVVMLIRTKETPRPTTRGGTLFDNSLLGTGTLVLYAIITSAFGNFSSRNATIIGVVIFAAVSGLSWFRISIPNFIGQMLSPGPDRPTAIVMLLSLGIVMGMGASIQLGRASAERRLTGKGGERIKFVFKEPQSELEGKEFLLLLHIEEKYYVAEPHDPPSPEPQLFVIPDELVRYAISQPIDESPADR